MDGLAAAHAHVQTIVFNIAMSEVTAVALVASILPVETFTVAMDLE